MDVRAFFKKICTLKVLRDGYGNLIPSGEPQVCDIDLATVFDAILTSTQTREKFQCLYENLMSNNFRRTAVLKKILIVN